MRIRLGWRGNLNLVNWNYKGIFRLFPLGFASLRVSVIRAAVWRSVLNKCGHELSRGLLVIGKSFFFAISPSKSYIFLYRADWKLPYSCPSKITNAFFSLRLFGKSYISASEAWMKITFSLFFEGWCVKNSSVRFEIFSYFGLVPFFGELRNKKLQVRFRGHLFLCFLRERHTSQDINSL
ncbi:unnamed protein product [Blepharisma stoltei]|uniref:Uncharacterized protein n=1 Tax=Blepharisma stoltei TaxID=1481888 RepID=A0AAU9JCN6_9CILI|nr:unnamed protein product [Blepharisma stoltei]